MLKFLKSLLEPAPSIDFKALMEKGAVVVDVRSPAEFKSGHLQGSTNIPLDQIGSQAAKLAAQKVPVIVVCRSGGRSSMAKDVLKNAGVDVYNGGPWNALRDQISK
jgi:rhodanese-related sulfurtransferase